MRPQKNLTHLIAAVSAAAAIGCHKGSTGASDAGTTGDMPVPQSMFDKYGGAQTVARIVSDAITALDADCMTAPYFAVVGQTGHDSPTRLATCLELQLTVAMGGPGVYPGMSANGDQCESMTMIHSGLGITSEVFDQFMIDFGDVLSKNGVTPDDLTTLSASFEGLKMNIVEPGAVGHGVCGDGGTLGDL